MLAMNTNEQSLSTKEDQTMDKRWTTKFAIWVRAIGVQNLVFQMRSKGHSVSPACVYLWISGTNAPHHKKAKGLVEIAGGQLTLEDIYNHQEEVKTNE